MFLVSQKTGKVKSAVRVIPGTKEKPHKIKEFGEGFAVQTDNILAEFMFRQLTTRLHLSETF
jgi:hypothetical protein